MTVNFDDIEILATDDDGGNIYYHNDEPFTGLIVEYHHGTLIGEITVVKGNKNGRIALYYDNGQIQKEYFQRYNRPYGIAREWDEAGNLLQQHDYGPEYHFSPDL